MSMDKENFFIEGSGRAVILNDSGSLDLIHLQNMSLELSSTMEQIYGGESNFSLYSYQTDRGARVTFTNASMNINILNMVQGTQLDPKVVLFAEEKLTVTSEGKVNFQKVPGTNDQIDWNTVVASKVSDGTRVEITRDATDPKVGNVATSLAGTQLDIFYTYVTAGNDAAVGTSIMTTSIPGYVTIYHRSKPMKQKNGRIVRVYTTLFKCRADGSLTVNFEHKNAFAPELAFDVVDPERDDKRFMAFSIKDTTTEDTDDANLIYPIN